MAHSSCINIYVGEWFINHLDFIEVDEILLFLSILHLQLNLITASNTSFEMLHTWPPSISAQENGKFQSWNLSWNLSLLMDKIQRGWLPLASRLTEKGKSKSSLLTEYYRETSLKKASQYYVSLVGFLLIALMKEKRVDDEAYNE